MRCEARLSVATCKSCGSALSVYYLLQTHTLKLQMESANLSSTTDEFRVQLMSLEYN